MDPKAVERRVEGEKADIEMVWGASRVRPCCERYRKMGSRRKASNRRLVARVQPGGVHERLVQKLKQRGGAAAAGSRDWYATNWRIPSRLDQSWKGASRQKASSRRKVALGQPKVVHEADGQTEYSKSRLSEAVEGKAEAAAATWPTDLESSHDYRRPSVHSFARRLKTQRSCEESVRLLELDSKYNVASSTGRSCRVVMM